MALWIRNRPPERCHDAEVTVAGFLADLSDDWVICWGFMYQDQKGTQREGDFLVLGPQGGLLVLEVKSGTIALNPYTGVWNTASGDNPRFQLDDEWKAVLETMEAHEHGRPSLFVGRALGTPDLSLAPDTKQHHGIPREFIFDRGDLRRFAETWDSRMAAWNARLDPRSRDIFLDCYGRDAAPCAITHFVDDTDRVLLRQTEATYPLLEQLADNRQFMVSGGVGSGKTWLAVELARRWARDHNQRVLFLGYNLAFTGHVRDLIERLVAKRKLPEGAVTVRAWEELARERFERAGLPFEPPADGPERTQFFEDELPAYLRQLVVEGMVTPAYDALIVDEAQDHATSLGPSHDAATSWWPVYWKLLHRGVEARIAVFYDAAQRPAFRKGTFEPSHLLQTPGFNPVGVRLQGSVRFTRTILDYLKGLDSPATRHLVAGLEQVTSLPTGPEVLEQGAAPGGEVAAIDGLLRGWFTQGWCRPEQVAILSRYGSKAKSALATCAQIGGVPLHDGLIAPRGEVAFGSVNRAKGLDRLAVVVLDFAPWSQLSDADRVSFFMGASRAWQLLAVVATRAVAA